MSPFGIGRGKQEGEEGQEPEQPDAPEGAGWPEKEAPAPPAGEQPPPVQDPDPAPEPVAAFEPEPAAPEPAAAAEQPQEESSRVAVVQEPAAPDEDEEYQWHTGLKRPTGVPDAIEFIDVHKAFGRNRILRGLNMGLPEGRISMILGPSGTGKSVCIKHMVGLLYPDEGDVLVHGESVPNMQDDELFDMRKKFGVLFQDGALFGSMNLYDNVAFPLRQHTDKSEEEVGEIVNRRLREVGLSDAGDKMPNELSGGMRKRAGFARALVLDPDIVLFDEPDSGLDPVRTALLCELIQEVHDENGGAYCVITHDIMSARRVAEHICVLWKGRIVESGPAKELFDSENAFVRQFLSGEAQGPLGME
ncbi:MAG: phospholipid/cholesterol/gamma-HCH transport system ATP-binding protein [Solirubrobacteraceae bacterium]|jgi:phospholipid/cholesterol/gamma-HCH transport system ATP-binding protein|nr:phospholipid/cholesterol/gamma-HCH transport system ATP-binding protein [Solirubrobacteraceae bacterium]